MTLLLIKKDNHIYFFETQGKELFKTTLFTSGFLITFDYYV